MCCIHSIRIKTSTVATFDYFAHCTAAMTLLWIRNEYFAILISIIPSVSIILIPSVTDSNACQTRSRTAQPKTTITISGSAMRSNLYGKDDKMVLLFEKSDYIQTKEIMNWIENEMPRAICFKWKKMYSFKCKSIN